jgi:hypothetical protein
MEQQMVYARQTSEPTWLIDIDEIALRASSYPIQRSNIAIPAQIWEDG